MKVTILENWDPEHLEKLQKKFEAQGLQMVVSQDGRKTKKEEFIDRLLSDNENEFFLEMEISLYMAKNSPRWRSPSFLFDCKTRCLVYDEFKRTGRLLQKGEFQDTCGCCIFIEEENECGGGRINGRNEEKKKR
ncbi:MAG: hypothetical protein HXS54_01425 [Theionarchaea archaeon]|nr:hypothetical protein [Theionarchaea archaeon]